MSGPRVESGMHVPRTNPLPIVGVSHMTHQHLSTRLAIWARFDMVGVITNGRHTHVMNSAPGLGDLVCPTGSDCDHSHLVGALK